MKTILLADPMRPQEHRDYFFIYIVASLWALSYLLFTPPTAEIVLLDRVVVWLWLGATVVGSILALIGLITKDNLLLERLGVTILVSSPLVYSALQLGIILYYALGTTHTDDTWLPRIYLVFFGLWVFFFINKRRRQLSLKVHQIKAAESVI